MVRPHPCLNICIALQEPLPTLLRAGGEDRGRATFFGANASCTSTRTIADLKLNALEPDNVRDLIEKVRGLELGLEQRSIIIICFGRRQLTVAKQRCIPPSAPCGTC